MVRISRFSRYRALDATWHNQVAATWQVVRATHGMRRCGIARAPKSKCASGTWQDSNTCLLSLRQVRLMRGKMGKRERRHHLLHFFSWLSGSGCGEVILEREILTSL